MRCLTLSGGGAYGSYQVGAISELCAYGRSWNKIIGVSVGAVNGALIAQFQPLEQNEGARQLRSLWTNTIRGSESLYHGWPFGLLESLLSKGSINDTTPLLGIIQSNLSMAKIKAAGVDLKVGAVDLCSGEYRLLGTDRPDFARCILASASFPAAFQPVSLHDGVYVDGGVINVTPIDAAIQDPDVTEIDVVMCNPIERHRSVWDRSRASSVIEVAKRCAEIMAGEVILNDLEGRLSHPKIKHVVYPKVPFVGDPLDFNTKSIAERISLGEKDARALFAK